MSEQEPVTRIITPTRLSYEFTAVGAHAEFLSAIKQGRILGRKCPSCAKVYVPARASCPRCGVAMEESVEVADRGTVATFCIVNVPSENIEIKLPYVTALIVLDGADIAIYGLIQECDYNEVRAGMRVEAVWHPKEEWDHSMANIKHFRPTGEPDVAISLEYKE